uniref:Beta-lactamase-related domain-containing protein n=1 Tax=Haptolina ericina TaxID=156174 RepID=A0A7S3EQD9_9EUKA|mmetsp:Transcript_12988/g.29658  ORF Transcript_12988/g.29658 Transcript_12988/m.29658 type:complete len:141 (+) Transcript_12988:1-423(+)
MGSVLTPDSLAQMMDWKQLTKGFAVGTDYGFGLFKQELHLPLKGSCKGLPGCKCVLNVCELKTEIIMHAGLDYGSGFPTLGWFPDFNVSVALATNTGEQSMGMNTTMGIIENMDFIHGFSCALFQAVIQLASPEFPDFDC